MLRVLLAAVVGGLVLFIWGFVSWVVLGWHETSGFSLQNEERIVAAIEGGSNEDGLYWIPGFPPNGDEEVWAEKHRAGPRGLLIYHPDGEEPMAPLLLIKGLLLSIFAALIASMILSMAGSHRGFVGRVAIVLLLGMFLAVASDLMMWNYMMFPTDFTLVSVADRVAGWLLVGIALAAIVKPASKVVQVPA